jgi:hypothetical protein
MVFLLNGCTVKPPKVTPCSIVNIDTAECRPPDKPSKDVPLHELLGYTCYHPDDIAAAKAYFRKILQNLNEGSEYRLNQILLEDN